MDECRITVLMSVYNCENTIEKCIDSLLAQDYPGWKMVVCDDASTDSTFDILNRYKEKYLEKFIVLKNDTNRRTAYSVNRCLEFADTEFIARMDGDDYCAADRFSKEIEFLDKHRDFDLVGSSMHVFDGQKVVATVTHKQIPQKKRYCKNLLLYKRLCACKKRSV